MAARPTTEQRDRICRARSLVHEAAAILDALGDLPGAQQIAAAQKTIADRLDELESGKHPHPPRLSDPQRLRDAIRSGPLGAVDARALELDYVNPRKALADGVADGRLHRVARGIYMARPRTATDRWKPTIETAAVAVGALRMGQEIPLMGMSAARLHNALPRAINRAWLAAPRTHRPVQLCDGGVVQFVTRRGLGDLDVEKVATDLGAVTVTTVEQTILDLMRRWGADGMEGEIEPVVRALADQTDFKGVARLVVEGKGSRAALDRFMKVLA